MKNLTSTEVFGLYVKQWGKVLNTRKEVHDRKMKSILLFMFLASDWNSTCCGDTRTTKQFLQCHVIFELKAFTNLQRRRILTFS